MIKDDEIYTTLAAFTTIKVDAGTETPSIQCPIKVTDTNLAYIDGMLGTIATPDTGKRRLGCAVTVEPSSILTDRVKYTVYSNYENGGDLKKFMDEFPREWNCYPNDLMHECVILTCPPCKDYVIWDQYCF